MASEDDLQILGSGAAAWNARRRQAPDYRPKLRNAVLRGLDLQGVDLRQADLSGADLEGANLREADLSRAELNRANLQGADLSESDLVGAVLTEADLRAANLRSATVLGAQLGQANLTGADLTLADLAWVNFSRANLSRARLRQTVLIQTVFHQPTLDETDFEEALIGSTIFAGADLRKVKGLERARYRSPADITISTFYLSQGQIPEALLQAAEVPPDFVAHNRSLFSPRIEFYSCFISYDHQDKPFALRLNEDLRELGIRTWLDDQQVLPGDHLLDAIDRGIRLWDKVLLCCSRASLNSRWVDLEVDKAMRKEEHLWRERGRRVLALIPLDLDGYLFEWQGSKASELTARFAPSFSGWEQDDNLYRQVLERLVRALRAAPDSREAPPRPLL